MKLKGFNVLSEIDDGMIHKSTIEGERMIIFKNPFSNVENTNNGSIHGFVSIENGQFENEGGNEFGIALSNFHGTIYIA